MGNCDGFPLVMMQFSPPTSYLFEAIGRHFFWALGRQFQRAHVKRPGSRWLLRGPTGGEETHFWINKLIKDIHPRKLTSQPKVMGVWLEAEFPFHFSVIFNLQTVSFLFIYVCTFRVTVICFWTTKLLRNIIIMLFFEYCWTWFGKR